MAQRLIDVATSLLATAARLGYAERVGTLGARPAQPVVLYEFEGCPFCRKVREALTVLDIDAMIYPCPQNGPRYREELRERGGKAQFPYLIDPNAGVEMYESNDINRHLFERYGNGGVPLMLSLPIVTDLTSSVATLVRISGGRYYRAAHVPEQPLELYGYEGSPFSRIAREVLCELEIPYLLHNVAHKSPRRAEFMKRSGKMMVPYLVDPNTNTEMFESAAIVAYLNKTYATS